ncbi:MAG: septum formation initiator family protein [Treponema sp.]|jgi:cell division protein FtsL|nr:septum formation initiator family protein [Treponema sp.]
MNSIVKNVFYKIGVCLLAVSIPLLLLAYAVQTRRYAELSREIAELESKQERLIEQNKKLVSDISLLSSTDRIEKIASEELGMHKAETEDIVRVEMNGSKK